MQMLIKLRLNVSLAVEAGGWGCGGGLPSNMRVVSLCTGFVAWL